MTEDADPRPVLFVTNHAPSFRAGAFAALHATEEVVFALVGGDVRHGGAMIADDPAFPAIRVNPYQKSNCALNLMNRAPRIALGFCHAGPYVLFCASTAFELKML